MKVGDVLIAKKGRSIKSLLGNGHRETYFHDTDRAEYPNLRTVQWHSCRTPIRLNNWITTKMLTRFTPYKQELRWTSSVWWTTMPMRPQNGKGGSEDPGRRPNLNFVEMGIPIESRLVSVKTGKEAIVASQNRVTFLGEEMSLTEATRRTVGRVHPCPQWTFNGRNLSEIYEETYGKKPPPEIGPKPYTIATALADLFVEESHTPAHPQLHRPAQEPDPSRAAGGRQDVHRQANRVVPDRVRGSEFHRDGAVPPVLCLRGLRAGLASDGDGRLHTA